MTRDGGFFTDSQEQALKELYPEIDMEQLPLSLSGLDIPTLEYNSQEYANNSGYVNIQNGAVQNGAIQNGAVQNGAIQNDAIQNDAIEDNKLAVQQIVNVVEPIYLQPPLQQYTPILGKMEFDGPYNFQLILQPQNSGKHWIYSEKLSKVFIHMEEVLPLQFQWNPPVDGLWVRATLVYKLDQYRSQPVVRCHNHMAPGNSSNNHIDGRLTKHVVRCRHTTSTYEEIHGGHLSVITPLGTPEAGINNVPMDFEFYCKNSCASGMNRRSTELIFTLENNQSEIVGRRKLEVRICSCPKRDKEKEEAELNASKSAVPSGKKRKATQSPESVPPPQGKKLCTDSKVYTINIDVVGRENASALLKHAYDLMAGSAMRTGNAELYKPYMDSVLSKTP